VVQAEEDEPGAQAHRALAAGQGPDGQQGLDPERRDRQLAPRLGRRDGGSQSEAQPDGAREEEGSAEDPALPVRVGH